MSEYPARWCILRTSNQNTLRLVRTLDAAGFTAWTPTEERTIIVPSANVKRRLPFAIMPGYAFADASGVIDLLEMAREPIKRERKFRVFRQHDGSPAIISDNLLAPIRSIERRRKPRGAVKAVPVGATVRLSEGGFAGLDGVVQSVRNKIATVMFAGFPVPVQIGCWLLQVRVDEGQAVNVNAHSSEQDTWAA